MRSCTLDLPDDLALEDDAVGLTDLLFAVNVSEFVAFEDQTVAAADVGFSICVTKFIASEDHSVGLVKICVSFISHDCPQLAQVWRSPVAWWLPRAYCAPGGRSQP